MDYIIEVLEKSFDYYFISMIILGNTFLWHLNFYPEKLLAKKKSKVYLTALHSLFFGFIYHYLNTKGNVENDLKIMLNSYLLATSLYELGLKEVIEYLKGNTARLIIRKIESKSNEDSNGFQFRDSYPPLQTSEDDETCEEEEDKPKKIKKKKAKKNEDDTETN